VEQLNPQDRQNPPPPFDTVYHGDCIDIMAAMPPESVDFILTDPPYITRYQSRDGRTVANDDNAAWLEPTFARMHRVLKPDSFCVSFYGWPKAGLFLSAWRQTGFRLAGSDRADHFLRPVELAPVNILENMVQGLPGQVLLLNAREKAGGQMAGDDGHRLFVHESKTPQAVMSFRRRRA
jgi:hypothetical protein